MIKHSFSCFNTTYTIYTKIQYAHEHANIYIHYIQKIQYAHILILKSGMLMSMHVYIYIYIYIQGVSKKRRPLEIKHIVKI